MAIEVDVNLYLKTKPGRDELAAIVAVLEDPVEDLVRKDSYFEKLGLDPAAFIDDRDAVIGILAAHPRLLQRPILRGRDRAIIGRPRDRVREFLTAARS